MNLHQESVVRSSIAIGEQIVLKNEGEVTEERALE